MKKQLKLNALIISSLFLYSATLQAQNYNNVSTEQAYVNTNVNINYMSNTNVQSSSSMLRSRGNRGNTNNTAVVNVNTNQTNKPKTKTPAGTNTINLVNDNSRSNPGRANDNNQTQNVALNNMDNNVPVVQVKTASVPVIQKEEYKGLDFAPVSALSGKYNGGKAKKKHGHTYRKIKNPRMKKVHTSRCAKW